MKRKKKSNIGLFLFILFLIGCGVGFLYLKNSKLFEANQPIIEVEDNLFWNLKSNIKIRVADDSGVKFVQAILTNSNDNSVVVLNKIYQQALLEDTVEIPFPKVGFFAKDGKVRLTINVVDSSMWNLLQGNKASKDVEVKIDTTKPKLNSLTNSYSITKGGSALVVFGVKDENLDKLYIKTNYGKKFYPTPFYKKGFYASLLAWPLNEKHFSATIVAVDKAKNISKSKVRLYLLNKNYRQSNITLKENFLDGKIAELANTYKENFDKNQKIDNFKFVNETLRDKNEKLIHKVAADINREYLKDFNIKPFYPLRNAAAVASYGDYRFFKYGEDTVSQSYHLGIDLASVKNARIVSTNEGRVVYTDMNGIYGNTVIVDHNLGLMTLYSHCFEFKVKKDDILKEKQVVALSGKTGLALGDHLHFGVLVQGVEVRPDEWMDKSWISKNITSVFDGAKYMIDKNKGL